MIQTLEKSRGILISAFIAIAFLSGCADSTGHRGSAVTGKISIEGKQEIAAFTQVTAEAVSSAIVTAAANAATQYTTTGKVDKNQLAAAEIYGFTNNGEHYLGELVNASTLTDGIKDPAVAAAVSDVIPASTVLTQVGLDSLNAAAAKLYTPPKA